MHKPDQLKRVLLAHVPGLQADPDRLAIFVDKGKVICRGTKSLSFAYEYTLNIVIQDYTGTHNELMMPILAWVAEQQPDLFDRPPHEAISFESEILDADASDVSIDLQLSERVLVERGEDGKYQVRHLDDGRTPDAFAGVCGVNLWYGMLGEDIIVERPADSAE